MSIHIGAGPGEIAETVLLPGDPLRAQFIAEKYLTDSVCYSKVRNMLGFTGIYQGVKVSVQGTGMGMPSTAIYTHELIHAYGVKNIVRVGTMGSIQKDLKLGEVVLAMSACTDSSMNKNKFSGMDFAPTAHFDLLLSAHQIAKQLEIPVQVGSIFSTDVFYNGNPDRYQAWTDHGVLGLEMESAALYTLAAGAQVKALTILTVSDNILTGEMMSSEERETKNDLAAKLALEVARGL